MWKAFFAMFARAFAAGAGAYASGAPVGAAASTTWPRHTPTPLPRRAQRARTSTVTPPHAMA